MRLFVLGLAAAALPLLAADPTPEIQRQPLPPQAVGARTVLRNIPEACTRLEGLFTGDAARPYTLAAVRNSPACQARARFVEAAQMRLSEAGGWKFNDRILVPNADCPAQRAVVRVWRHPAAVAPPRLDAQGRARIYLQESLRKAQAAQLPPVPMYAATVAVEGSCGGGA